MIDMNDPVERGPVQAHYSVVLCSLSALGKMRVPTWILWAAAVIGAVLWGVALLSVIEYSWSPSTIIVRAGTMKRPR